MHFISVCHNFPPCSLFFLNQTRGKNTKYYQFRSFFFVLFGIYLPEWWLFSPLLERLKYFPWIFKYSFDTICNLLFICLWFFWKYLQLLHLLFLLWFRRITKICCSFSIFSWNISFFTLFLISILYFLDFSGFSKHHLEFFRTPLEHLSR